MHPLTCSDFIEEARSERDDRSTLEQYLLAPQLSGIVLIAATTGNIRSGS